MLDVLYKVEKEFPYLLENIEDWNSLDIDYHPPHVERLWMQYGAYRIMLHKIYPCDISEALFHKHPWKSAMRIVKGEYEMRVGYNDGNRDQVILTETLHDGDVYEMCHPKGMHSVRPIVSPVFTVMVTGKLFQSEGKKKKDLKLGPLSEKRKNELITFFRKKYT